jgi:hypothetical protein
MSDITRAEFDALAQKVDEIHRMLKNWGGQPNVVMMQPYPMPPFVVTCQNPQPDPWHFSTLPSKTTGETQ